MDAVIDTTHGFHWDGLPAEIQNLILGNFRPQRGSKVSGTNRQFRDALHWHWKLTQLHDPERFVRDTLELLSAAPRCLDVDVSGELFNTVALYCTTGVSTKVGIPSLPAAVILRLRERAFASRATMQSILRNELEGYARRIKGDEDIRRFFKRIDTIFRFAAYGQGVRDFYGSNDYDRLQETLLSPPTPAAPPE
jgi:hypothetical protein